MIILSNVVTYYSGNLKISTQNIIKSSPEVAIDIVVRLPKTSLKSAENKIQVYPISIIIIVVKTAFCFSFYRSNEKGIFASNKLCVYFWLTDT